MKTNIKFKRYVRNDLLQCKEFSFSTFGTKYWYLNGSLHREDGPAVEIASGIKKEWWLNGKQFLYEKRYWEAIEKYKKKNKTNK